MGYDSIAVFDVGTFDECYFDNIVSSEILSLVDNINKTAHLNKLETLQLIDTLDTEFKPAFHGGCVSITISEYQNANISIEDYGETSISISDYGTCEIEIFSCT